MRRYSFSGRMIFSASFKSLSLLLLPTLAYAAADSVLFVRDVPVKVRVQGCVCLEASISDEYPRNRPLFNIRMDRSCQWDKKLWNAHFQPDRDPRSVCTLEWVSIEWWSLDDLVPEIEVQFNPELE